MLTNSAPNAMKPAVFYYVLIAFALLVFVQTFSLLAPIYLSFILTFLISLALNPVVNWLRKLMGGRKSATALVVLAMISMLALSGGAFYLPLRDSLSNLSDVLPGYWERLQKPLIKMEQQAKLSETRLQAEVTSEMENEKGPGDLEPAIRAAESTEAPSSPDDSNTLRSNLIQMLRGVIGSFTRVAFNGAQMVMVLVTVFFGVIFMLMNPKPVVSSLFSLVPKAHHDTATAILERICRFAPSWGGSTLAGMLTIGLLVFALMWPLLGVMDAMVLGLVAGLLESVPFLGPTLSAFPALLLAIGKGGMTPLWVLLAYVGVQALENNIILPMIMAKGMKLHAMTVIFSMLLCVSAFGVLGVLIAAPLAAIVSILHEEIYRKRFLPAITDEDLDSLAVKVLQNRSHERG